MLPSSGPKRVNYYWSGKTISKIISCVAFDGNNCRGTDLVLGLEENSSPEPLLWGRSLVPAVTYQCFSSILSSTDSRTEPQHLAWLGRNMTHHRHLSKLSFGGVKTHICPVDRKSPLAQGRHICHSRNSLMVWLYICVLTYLLFFRIWIPISILCHFWEKRKFVSEYPLFPTKLCLI